MISRLFFLVISSSLITTADSTISDQYFINRQELGDLLYGPGLDCTFLGGYHTDNNACICAGYGSYYTDQNGRTMCFKSRGEDELGKVVFELFYVTLLKLKGLFT